ncbi:MAG: tRNA 2-thiouridine(34) synthase MnmA [Deltaproteobacteria bacterium]|nr:tRNA 2-thiouridine(34) synthase MnmA [Deltaproteobacteria bacterium]
MEKKPSTVIMALSGGVDSSLGAALLKQAGWKVTGVHFLLPTTSTLAEKKVHRAARVARRIGIPFETIDLRDDFTRKIIRPFQEAYLKGETPNPCALCNSLIKFETLLGFAREKGIDCVATGHYARVRRNAEGLYELRRGIEPGKEQSYFLHRLNQKFLSRILFPLGNLTKRDAREMARRFELPTASEPESQEICFIPGNDYRAFLERNVGKHIVSKGDIVNLEGEKVGEHLGTYRYTIGQRHGLGIASSRPYYVREIRAVENLLVVGRKEDLLTDRLEAEDFNWVEGKPDEGELDLTAQIRYRHRAAPGRLRILGKGRVVFKFREPQWAVTPGQALVCYDGDRVVGGGWIRTGTFSPPDRPS